MLVSNMLAIQQYNIIWINFMYNCTLIHSYNCTRCTSWCSQQVYECTMDQKLTSHAFGGLAGSRRTPLQWAEGEGHEITPWPPSWNCDVASEIRLRQFCLKIILIPLETTLSIGFFWRSYDIISYRRPYLFIQARVEQTFTTTKFKIFHNYFHQIFDGD